MELTDDLGLSPEFLADEDVARDEDNCGRGRRCTCGRLDALDQPRDERWTREDIRELVDSFPGCAGCDPVDWEGKPYGFGVERWEDAPLMAAQRACRFADRRPGLLSDATRQGILEAARTVYSARRQRHSAIVWGRICDRAETHRQAVEAYAAWAARAVTVRYRDDSPARGRAEGGVT